MKNDLLIILISFLFVGIFDVKASNPYKNKTIVIDPGHGGKDPGTVYKDIYEKDINLKISTYLKEELGKIGFRVSMTREGDYDLSKPNALYRKKSDFDNRIKIINEADYYLSIHLNYLEDEKYSGIQVFSVKDNIQDAIMLQKHLNNYRKSKLIPDDTYMYHKLTTPGLLIECGFLSNYEDRKKLITKEYQKSLAKKIARGIQNLTSI